MINVSVLLRNEMEHLKRERERTLEVLECRASRMERRKKE